MKRFICLLSGIVFVGLFSAPVFAQMQDRRMIFDRYECNEPATESKDEDSKCLIELVNVEIAGQKIASDKTFVADAGWLKNLKVRVKNVSGKPLVFVGVSFGMIEGLYEELAPSASWGWGFGLYRGQASNPNDAERKTSKHIILKPNKEIELTFADLRDPDARLLEAAGRMSQIVLRTAIVVFEDGKQVDSFLFIKRN